MKCKPFDRTLDFQLALPETIYFLTIYDFSRSHKDVGKEHMYQKKPPLPDSDLPRLYTSQRKENKQIRGYRSGNKKNYKPK